MPLAAVAGIGAAGSIFTGLLGANAAGNAANVQANAANAAANLQYGNEQQALNFQKLMYGNNLALAAPYLSVGRSGLANLANLMGVLPPDSSAAAAGGGMAGANNPAAAANGGASGIGDPRFGPPIYTVHGKAYQYAGQDAGRDVYKPYTADQALANDKSKWATMGAGGANDFSLGVTSDWKPGSQNATSGVSGVPNLQNGTISLSSLINPDLGATGSLAKGFDEKFAAPTNITEQNDPGFQARLKLGQDALERSAAAKGNLLTGGFMKDLNSFAQDYASNEYGNVYNRAFNEYAQRYNMFNTGQTNLYNRLANLAGMGQTSTNQLGYLGQNAAGNIGSILMNSAGQQGQDLQNAAAARASGYVGSANAYGGIAGGIGSSLSNYLLLSKLLGNGGTGLTGIVGG